MNQAMAFLSSVLGLMGSLAAHAEATVSIHGLENQVNPYDKKNRIVTTLFSTTKLGTDHAILPASRPTHRQVRVVLEGMANDAYIVVPEADAQKLLDFLNSGLIKNMIMEVAKESLPSRVSTSSGLFTPNEISVQLNLLGMSTAVSLQEAIAIMEKKKSEEAKKSGTAPETPTKKDH